MKKPRPADRARHTTVRRGRTGKTRQAHIHPVLIYPFRQPDDYTDLKELYGLVADLAARRETYARPITVLDRKTHHAMAHNRRFLEFRDGTVARHSDILDAWCVDTCQMWYAGLGAAFERGGPQDVYWLIPGDFNYGSPMGHEVLSRLHDLPEICVELGQDVCIGEIATDHNHSKQLIDTYGTFALLYNWFPAAAQEIRGYTERPRSEFLALRHAFLGDMLKRRWYAYEQTVVILLRRVAAEAHQPVFGGRHLRPAGRARHARLGHAAGRAHRARLEVRVARAQRNPGRLEPTLPAAGNPVRTGPPDGVDHPGERAALSAPPRSSAKPMPQLPAP